MLKFIQAVSANQDAIWLFEDMERTIINGGNMWIVHFSDGDVIITNEKVIQICNDRISAMVKLLSGSNNFELKYLRESIKWFNGFKEFNNENNRNRKSA